MHLAAASRAATVRPATSATSGRRLGAPAAAAAAPRRRQVLARSSHTVELQDLDGNIHVMQVADGESLLDVAIEQGLDMPHDCKMGVCLRCSAMIESGDVVQPGGMISEECMEQGYALLCVAYPKSDCKVRVIPEDELVDAVMEIS